MMPRFAVLDHDHPEPHRDLLLEAGGVLRAWRLLPAFDPTSPVPAVPIPDHRLAYLDYEGEVSAGRGVVSRWDGGGLEWEAESVDEIRVRLSGHHLRGAYRLHRVGPGWVFQTGEPAA